MRPSAFLAAAIALVAALPAVAADQIQIVSGGTRMAIGPDGTAYLIGQGTIVPSPSAYRSTPSGTRDFVERLDLNTGNVFYATYLNFQVSGIFIGADGSAYLTGSSFDPKFPITPGAYDRHITGGEEMVIAKLNPQGSAMTFVTVLGGSQVAFFGGIHGIVVGPDGAIYVTGNTYSTDFATTADAFQSKPTAALGNSTAFLVELSPDASRLVYSSYLGASQSTQAMSVSLGDDGQIHVAGRTDAPDFPTTPGTFSLPLNAQPFPTRCFLASWNIQTHQFTSLAAFGSYLNPLAFAWTGHSVAVEAYNGDKEQVPAPNIPLWPADGSLWHASGAGNMVILILDEANWQIRYATGFPDSFTSGMAFDTDGSLIIVGSNTGEIPASIGAFMLRSSSGSFVAKLDATLQNLLAATYFEPGGISGGTATITADRIYVLPFAFPAPPFSVSPPFPIIVKRPPRTHCAAIYAWPKIAQQCGATPLPPQFLSWSVCEPAFEQAEIHVGSPVGPAVASANSGVTDLAPANTTYYLVGSNGRVLASEQTAYQRAPRCSAVPNPTGQLTATPNPVLSCRENPLTGTATTLQGLGPTPFDIRVGTSDGPLLNHTTAGPGNVTTGDWVRDGLAFFMTDSATGTPLAMERVFLLPIRSCLPGAPPPPPAIQAKPAILTACGATATLAWYSAGIHPVDIRDSNGVIARFDQTSGLLDVAPNATTTYHLYGYSEGEWKHLAADTITVAAPGCSNSQAPL